MSKRQSDEAQLDIEFARSKSRVFCRNDAWYFSSREGDFGPFDTELDAQEELEAYVHLIDLRPENETPVTPDA